MANDGAGATRRPGVLGRIVAWMPAVTLLIGVPSLVVALVLAVRDLDGVPLPGPLRWLGATAATVAFLLLASASYAALFDAPTRRLAHRSFLRSQLLKYNPFGAVAQPTSQALLTSTGTGRSAAAVATVVSKATTGAGGLLWGPVVAAIADGLSAPLRVLCAIAPLGAALCHPAILAAVMRRVPRLGAVSAVPGPGPMVRSIALAFVAVGFAGLGFVLLAPADSPMERGPASVAGFALTWTVGYLALPFPGGVGVREAVATVLVPGAAAAVLVTAVVFRVTQLAVELALTAATYLPSLGTGATDEPDGRPPGDPGPDDVAARGSRPADAAGPHAPRAR